jgi:hypothetical protein
VHLVFPDLLGREALAHRPAQGEVRKIVFSHGTTVREQLGIIEAIGQIERIKRRRDWHAIDVGNIRAKLLPIEILDMGDGVSPLGSFQCTSNTLGAISRAW